MTWDGDEQVVGIRWNGDLNDPNDKGNPRSHGQATWFILPDEMAFFAKAFVEEAEAKAKQGSGIVS